MTTAHSTATPPVLVAVDVAKAKHDVLVELPDGRRKKMVVRNQLPEFRRLADYLRSLGRECLIAFEPTADYHRCLAYFLGSQGFELRLASSLSVARTREALHNSWDKNDPKDAQVILHLLRTGATQRFYDPVLAETNDLQELSKTHHQVSLRKTRIQHSLMNHYLPLYFPEAERFLCTTRAGWFARLLVAFPTPASVAALPEAEFVSTAARLVRTKHSKEAVLRSFHAKARQSVGLPVPDCLPRLDLLRALRDGAFSCESAAAVVSAVALPPPLAGAPEVGVEQPSGGLVTPDVAVDALMADGELPPSAQVTGYLFRAPLPAQQPLDCGEVLRREAAVAARA